MVWNIDVGLDLPRMRPICVQGSAKPLIMAKRDLESACFVTLSILARLSRASLIDLTTIGIRLTK